MANDLEKTTPAGKPGFFLLHENRKLLDCSKEKYECNENYQNWSISCQG